MSRNSKTKLKRYAEMPIQLASEANVAEHLVIEAEGSDSGVSEERKKEAEKPLYIKRM